MSDLRTNRINPFPFVVIPASQGPAVTPVDSVASKTQGEVRRDILEAYRALVYRSSYRTSSPTSSSDKLLNSGQVVGPVVTMNVPFQSVRPPTTPVQLAAILPSIPSTPKNADVAPTAAEGRRVYLQARALRA